MFTWWKMRQFNRRIEKLNVGATGEHICAVLGEPSQKKFAEDEEGAENFDEIWSFSTPRPNCEFSIALKDGIYSHAWMSWHHEN